MCSNGRGVEEGHIWNGGPIDLLVWDIVAVQLMAVLLYQMLVELVSTAEWQTEQALHPAGTLDHSLSHSQLCKLLGSLGGLGCRYRWAHGLILELSKVLLALENLLFKVTDLVAHLPYSLVPFIDSQLYLVHLLNMLLLELLDIFQMTSLDHLVLPFSLLLLIKQSVLLFQDCSCLRFKLVCDLLLFLLLFLHLFDLVFQSCVVLLQRLNLILQVSHLFL